MSPAWSRTLLRKFGKSWQAELLLKSCEYFQTLWPPRAHETRDAIFHCSVSWKIISNEYFLHSQQKPVIYSNWMEEYKNLEERGSIRDRIMLLQPSCVPSFHLNKCKILPPFLNPYMWLLIVHVLPDHGFAFPLPPVEWETCFPMPALPSPCSGFAQP